MARATLYNNAVLNVHITLRASISSSSDLPSSCAPTWVSFFKSYPVLEGFRLCQSPRFDIEGDQQARDILRNLERLDLSALTRSASCSEDRLLGVRLSHLDLSGHGELGRRLLKNGIVTRPYETDPKKKKRHVHMPRHAPATVRLWTGASMWPQK